MENNTFQKQLEIEENDQLDSEIKFLKQPRIRKPNKARKSILDIEASEGSEEESEASGELTEKQARAIRNEIYSENALVYKPSNRTKLLEELEYFPNQ